MTHGTTSLSALVVTAVAPATAVLLYCGPTPSAVGLLIGSCAIVVSAAYLVTRPFPILGHPREATTLPSSRLRDPDKLIEHLLPAVEECIIRREQEGDSGGDIRTQLHGCIRSVLEEAAQAPLGGEAKTVTVLLSDLRGFTVITETYAAREVVDMLNRYFDRMCRLIYRHGGSVDKFMGDSIMALFGAPVSKPDDVIQAVCCAVEMQIAMDSFNKENEALGMPNLYMGIGLNTGTVVAGKIGSDLHCEYTVIGDEVNLTSRIEAYTLRGQILMSNNTYDTLKKFVTVKEPIFVSVKGKREPVPLYEVVSVDEPYNLRVPEREVRRSLRVDVNIPFAFHVCEGKVVCSDTHQGYILNLSAGGMFAYTNTPIEPYMNVVFKLLLESKGIRTRDIYGKILRVKKSADSYETNIEFTIIDPDDRETIKSLVSRVIEGSF